MNKVLSSVKFVSKNSKDVFIDEEKIKEFSERILKDFGEISSKAWFEEGSLSLDHLNTEKLLLFLAIFHVSSFCYWGKPAWGHFYQGKRYERSYGLVSALLEESTKNKDFLSARYLSELSYSKWGEIVKDKGRLQFMKERWRFIKNLGEVILKEFDGSILNLISSSNREVKNLINKLTTRFEAFQDTSQYLGKEIFFLKKAQVLIGDIFYVGKIKGITLVKDPQNISACADYRLPQVLRHFNVLKYSKELAKKVDSEDEISKNSNLEIEIRANTIWASHLLGKILRKKLPHFIDLEVNNYIWLLSQRINTETKPHHRTKTTYY